MLATRGSHTRRTARRLRGRLAAALATAATAAVAAPAVATPGEAPTAKLVISPSPAIAGEQATLDASSSTPDSGGTAITTYYWDFNADGTHEQETTGPVITHAFAAGEHRVRVAVEDSEYDWSQTTVDLTVNEKAAEPAPSTPPEGAYDTSKYNPWWGLPSTWLVHEFTMPHLSPRARGHRPVGFKTLQAARVRLKKVLDKAGASVRIVEKHEALPKGYRDERRVKSTKHPLVLGQSPAPGTKVRASLGRAEQSVTIFYWDPAKDPLVKKEVKQEIKQDSRKKKQACKLISLGNNDVRRLLLAKTLKEAIAVARSYGCQRWEADFSHNTRIFKDIVTQAAVNKDGIVNFKVVLPKQPDFVMTFREDPTRLKSAHDLSLVATPGGDWVLPKSNLSISRMTVQVNELATGRFAAGASGVQVEIYDESTGKLLIRTSPDSNGEVGFQFRLPKETSLLIGAVLRRGDETMQAWRNIRVKNLGSTFTTVCGRRIALKKVNGKNVYRGNQAEFNRCKGLPVVPGNLGTGKGASAPRVPTVEERPALGVTANGSPHLIAGQHNAIEVSGENTIVGSAPGIIAAGGGNIIATGGGNRTLARGAGHVRANAAFFGQVGSLLQAIVAPLRQAWDNSVSNVRAMLPKSSADDLAKTRDALQAAGVPPVTPGGLVPEKVGIIAAGGGNIIATGGGNIIAAGGGNIIATGGGNLLSDKGLGIIATGGGNIIAAGGGNIMPVYGGRLIGHAGGN